MHRNLTLVSPKQERIAALVKQSPQMAFTLLACLMDLDWMKEAYRRTRKDGAVGVDVSFRPASTKAILLPKSRSASGLNLA
jgi:hypothetical protein